MNTFERLHRSAPPHAFRGGHIGHGDIMPMGYVADIERVRRPLLARLFGRRR